MNTDGYRISDIPCLDELSAWFTGLRPMGGWCMPLVIVYISIRVGNGLIENDEWNMCIIY